MRHLIVATTAVVLLVAGGLVHGFWTDRWQPAPDPALVAARFDALPTALGDWQAQTVTVSESDMRGLTGYLLRRYVHRTSGEAVTVSLMSGPPRVVSIHTPDACYAGSGFSVTPPAKHAAKDLPEPADFWTSEMTRTRQAEQLRLRIFFGWNAGAGWAAADSPRVAYAGTPTLYKLYLIRELPAGEAPLAGDPCLSLMTLLQPELKKVVAKE